MMAPAVKEQAAKAMLAQTLLTPASGKIMAQAAAAVAGTRRLRHRAREEVRLHASSGPTPMARTSKRLLNRKAPSREMTESNSCSGRSLGRRYRKSTILKTTMMARKVRKYGPTAE